MIRFLAVILSTLALLLPLSSFPQDMPEATDVTAIDIDAFIDALPTDSISDQAIRVVDVGGYNIGIFGVFRPQDLPGRPIRHPSRKSITSSRAPARWLPGALSNRRKALATAD